MEATKLKRIVIKEELYAITKDTIESIILGQFIYWEERVNDYDLFLKEEERRCLDNSVSFNVNLSNGWIYKKSSDLIDECMLSISENTVRRYINNLEEKGFISSRKNPNFKWDRTLQYRANMKFIIESIKNKGFDGLGGWNIQNKDTKLQNDDSDLQNDGAIPDTTIENTNNKESTNVDKKDEIDFDLVLSKWSEYCPMLSKPRMIDNKRKKMIISLLKNNEATIDDMFKCFKIMANSQVCNGDGGTWKASFDWFIKNTNSCFNGLLEGKYSFKGNDNVKYKKIMDGEDMNTDSTTTENNVIEINGKIYK